MRDLDDASFADSSRDHVRQDQCVNSGGRAMSIARNQDQVGARLKQSKRQTLCLQPANMPFTVVQVIKPEQEAVS